MNIFEDLIEELKEENLLEETVIETKNGLKKTESNGNTPVGNLDSDETDILNENEFEYADNQPDNPEPEQISDESDVNETSQNEQSDSENDRRINLIFLTKQAQKLQEETMALADETLNEALIGVPSDRIDVCKEVLQVVYDNLK